MEPIEMVAYPRTTTSLGRQALEGVGLDNESGWNNQKEASDHENMSK